MRNNMRNNIYKLIIGGLMCLCLTGCQKAPEKVVEDMKEYGENEQKKESEITYCSPQELKNLDVKAIMEKGYRVRIPDNIDFSRVEDVCELTVKFKENFVADYEKKYAELFGFDLSKLEESRGVGGRLKQGDDEEKKIHYGIRDNGLLAYMSGHWFDDATESKVEGRYDIFKDDIENVKIDFAGDSIRLSDMCKKSEEWFNTNIGTDTLTYNVTDALVRNVSYGSENVKRLSLCGEFAYKGIFFNNHLFDISEESGTEYTSILTNSVVSEYEAADDMVKLVVNDCLFEVTDAKKLDKIVDFESALRIVEEELTGFRLFEFCDVMPLYVMETVSDESDGIDPKAPGIELKARPVYAFLEKGDLSSDEMPDDITIALNKYRRYVYVDMVTGEFVTDIEK